MQRGKGFVSIDKYNELIKKWGEDKVTGAQEVLADENETYQETKGKFIDLDQQGKGLSSEAVKLEEKLFVMVDRFLQEQRQGQKGLFE